MHTSKYLHTITNPVFNYKKLIAFPKTLYTAPIVAIETQEILTQTPWGEMGIFCIGKPSETRFSRENQDRIVVIPSRDRMAVMDGMSGSEPTAVYKFLDHLTSSLMSEQDLSIIADKLKRYLKDQKLKEGLACIAVATFSPQLVEKPEIVPPTRFIASTILTRNQAKKFKNFLSKELFPTKISLPQFFNGKNEFYKELRSIDIQTIQDCLDLLTLFENNYNHRHCVTQTSASLEQLLAYQSTVYLDPGDTLMMCSDGCSDNIPVDQLGTIISKTQTVQATLEKIKEIIAGRERIEHHFLNWKEPKFDKSKPIKSCIHYGASPFNENYPLEDGTILTPIAQPKLDDKSIIIVRINRHCSIDIVNAGDCEVAIFRLDGSVRFKAESHSMASRWRQSAENQLATIIKE